MLEKIFNKISFNFSHKSEKGVFKIDKNDIVKT